MAGPIKIISIGAAVQDVFLSGKVFKPERDDDGKWVEELPLGAKLELEDITFSTGGGATNAAVTFARQGFKSQYVGMIGHDPAGAAVLAELAKEEVDTSHVVYSKNLSTGYSTLLLAPTGERTILTYRGASTALKRSDLKLDKLRADWIYVSSLAGNMEVLEAIVHFARARHIFVAVNPGQDELKHKERMRALLPHISLLSLNKEEMQQLVGGESIQELARNAAYQVPVAVVTDGPKGSAAADGKHLVTAGMYDDVPVLDRTGAGDAFASGFVAAVAKGTTLAKALIFASANSTSVVQKIGAKGGILHSHSRIHEMDVKVEDY